MLVSVLTPGVLIFTPDVYEDDRGCFFESYNKQRLSEYGITETFVQDNYSKSSKNVLRGLHYQLNYPQGKLVRVLSGEVYDVVVDLRKSSPAFGKWARIILSADTKQMMWIPPGFAHGFYVLSDTAEFFYKTTDYWHAGDERCIVWNDPGLGITWPIPHANPILSKKDAAGSLFKDADTYPA